MPDLIAQLINRIQSQLGTEPRLADIERQLRAELGGRWVYVAKRGERADVGAALRAGLSVDQVAERYGLSRRHVYRLKRGYK